MLWLWLRLGSIFSSKISLNLLRMFHTCLSTLNDESKSTHGYQNSYLYVLFCIFPCTLFLIQTSLLLLVLLNHYHNVLYACFANKCIPRMIVLKRNPFIHPSIHPLNHPFTHSSQNYSPEYVLLCLP